MSEGSNTVDEQVAKARAAMAQIADWSQEQVDMAVRAVAWSLYEPTAAKELAELAVADTGMGNVDDKIVKNTRKTFGTLRDLLRAKTVGLLDHDPATGIARYGKPVGVVGAVTPSTNPAATPINKAMMAIKGANAVILAPSPAGWSTTSRTADFARQALVAVGAPADLIQVLTAPVTREATNELMDKADMVVVTGSQNNVRNAYRSGTPAIGVGAGNVPVIIDTGADLDDAAVKITQSKTFDNATSCSSENSVIITADVYDNAMAALERAGAYRAADDEAERVRHGLFPEGKLNRNVIAQDFSVLAKHFELGAGPEHQYVMVEEPAPGPDRPLTGEKLSLVLTVYRADDFDHAVALTRQVLDVQGVGHSVGIHTDDRAKAERMAAELPVVRVLVNQAHTFGNGGSFDNSLPFTLSMGCGTWAGNSISENLNISHFINVTHLVETIEPDQPSEAELFGPLWEATGQTPRAVVGGN